VTVTAIQPVGRYGALRLSGNEVTNFEEKPAGESWVNGGFFALEPKVIDVIGGDSTSWEVGPLQALAEKGQVGGYQHRGFWHAMDTLRDKTQLENLWTSGSPPWRVWE
jgi:glucose-1-phosphate cytidylyltransferase